MPLHFIEDYMESVGGSEGKCGRKWTLPISGKYQYELVSNGRAVMGNCSTTVVVGRSSRCEKKICVRVEEWALDSDVMNVTFKGQKDGDMVSERGGGVYENCKKAQVNRRDGYQGNCIET